MQHRVTSAGASACVPCTVFACLLLLGACSDPAQQAGAASPAALAASGACNIAPGAAQHPGMVWVEAGAFTMGADFAYREEGPAHAAQVDGFWMDQSEVTNAQFAEFVRATGYVTLAERGIDDGAGGTVVGSAVFQPPAPDVPDPYAGWWRFREGASWRQPDGPGSDLAGLDQHPVVHVAYEDALAYARWKGHSLPTEAQFEYAAQTSVPRDAPGDLRSNTWQGNFPFDDEALDGYSGTAPVGCYGANALGLYDLIGNVWEWTASPYYSSHDFSARSAWPEGYDPAQPGEAVAVIKGGSWLCAPNYCMRYRPEARQGQSKGLGTSHIGFRTVLNP